MSEQRRRDRLRQLEQERLHFRTHDQDQDSDEDVCYATDHGGVRGKVKLTKYGRHSFVDLDSLASPELHSRSLELEPQWKASSILPKESVDRPHARSKSKLDAFDKLVAKDYRTRSRALLEEERTRYNMLEESYEKLLSQVQNLQATHLQDLRNAESRFQGTSSSLQKALVSKSEEIVSLSNKLAYIQAKYDKESRNWEKERVNFLSQIDLLSSSAQEAQTKLSDRERRLLQVNKLRKELVERVATREDDLIKYSKALRERETEYRAEKDARIQHQEKSHGLETELTKRSQELKELSMAYQRKFNEAEELSALKVKFNETKRDLDDAGRREKHFLSELENLTMREGKLFNQMEDLAAKERKYISQIAELKESDAQHICNYDILKQSETKLKEIVLELKKEVGELKGVSADLELVRKEKYEDGLKHDAIVKSLETKISELVQSRDALSHEATRLGKLQEQTELDKEKVLTRVTSLIKELQLKTTALDDLQNDYRALQGRLDSEMDAQMDLKDQHRERMTFVTSKIEELQEKLGETQKQTTDLKTSESNLRATLRQKEDAVRTQQSKITDLEHKLEEFQDTASREEKEFERYKGKTRDELLQIQEKYSIAKQQMDAEVTALRNSMSQKQNTIHNITDELTRLRSEVAEASQSNFSLETRISELVANEASYQRQIATLTSALNAKVGEVERIGMKHSAVLEQMKRMEAEVQMYRSNGGTRDTELTRLQGQMEEISKKIKKEVGVLEEPRSPLSAVGSKRRDEGRGKLGLIDEEKVPRMSRQSSEVSRQGSMLGDEFKEIERLLARSGA